MKERGILFTKENRIKSINGDKTQFRRVMKPQPLHSTVAKRSDDGDLFSDHLGNMFKPKYQVGDLLCQLEPYQIEQTHSIRCSEMTGFYLDDMDRFFVTLSPSEFTKFLARKKPYMKTSSRFMYKSLARHWYEVTAVRVERLQDISDGDCVAEGIFHCADLNKMESDSFRFLVLWDSVAKIEYKWRNNPWVWVYEYKKVSKLT